MYAKKQNMRMLAQDQILSVAGVHHTDSESQGWRCRWGLI